MTPVPLELPLRPAEAADVANLIFDHAERKPLTDDVRNRLAARAAVLKLQTITPYFGSLERDPVHPSVYYLAVDGESEPLLLHMALAAAPTSSIYHKPLLIGRMRRPNGPEMVINAIPFGPDERARTSRRLPRASTRPSIRSRRVREPRSRWKQTIPRRSTCFAAFRSAPARTSPRSPAIITR